MELYEFPEIKLPKEKKTEEYFLAWAKAIWSFDSNNTFLNKDIREKFHELRRYGAGNQDPERYRDVFTTLDTQTRDRKGYSNIDETIVPYSPKLKHGVMKMVNSGGSRMDVSFLDDESDDERGLKRAKALVFGKYKNDTMAVSQKLGVPMPEHEQSAESVDELNILEQSGAFKLKKEIALEKGLSYVFDYDDRWDMQTGFNIEEDLIDIGIAGIKPFIDPESNTIKFRAINPENIIVDYSDYVDYRDAKFFGEIIPVSVQDLMVEYKATTGKELTQMEIAEINQSCGTDHYTLSYVSESNFYSTPKEGKLNSDGFFVKVLDFVFESVDEIKKPLNKTIKKEVKINEKKVKQQEIDSGKVYEKDGYYYKAIDTGDTVDIRQWRRCKWIINTNVIYDYGFVYDQIRDNDYDPMPPFILERLRTKSIMEVIKPNLDSLQITMLKLQILQSKAAGKGLAIDVDSITNVALGADIYDPKEIIKLRELTGNYFYRLKAAGIPNSMMPISQAQPFKEIEGGMGSLFNELLMLIDFNLRMIQDNTGLSDIALAQRPNAEMGLGLNQMSLAASENIISNISYAYKNIKEKAAYVTALHLLQMAKHNPKHKYYTNSIGSSNWKELSTTAVFDIKSIGVKLSYMPTQDEIGYMIQLIERGMQTGRNGEPSITGDEAFTLFSMIKEGKPLSYINYVLRKYREQREQKSQERNMQNIQAQGAENQKAAQMANEGMLQKLNQEFEMKMKQMMTEYDLKLRNAIEEIEAESEAEQPELQQKRDDGSLKFMLDKMKLDKQNNTQI